MKEKYIIFSSLAACICLYFIEQYFAASYVVKTLSKLILFIALPMIYIKFINRTSISEELKLKQLDKKRLRLGFIFGLACFIIILAAFFIFRGFMDLDSIAMDLQQKNITSANFILIGLYITFGNSFLEEFFFRGFIFLNLYNKKNTKLAYVYSSLLFGLYHIAIFKTWFSLGLIMLCLFGLISVGFIFNWLNTKSNNFINSWLVHIFADAAIIIIGLRMFNML
ncbi:CPBP family intramembrane metalloprotease [Clostridium swellfunianum]|uniref:CPBP family intramembrane glutamic endopeptidase n=1 Tax=Clostridium swellfunianum TaxID=1367462 RepID=UPI00202F7054|nr:CPBP family intramembrane glutamic endopeptidase [Clostridium swellfunianum]MCM0650312.1 CPBP family intramembrane metalloprotease [Clostridium swellfunianum]